MKNRDSYFDNAKFFLILLVVFGHLIRSYIDDNDFIMNVYKFVYTFHMPAFILISGYFAKGFRKKGYLEKISKKLILPYLIFQGIYSVYYYIIRDQQTLLLNPFDPHWSLWFLVSLFCWNILLFFFTKLHPVWAISLAFAIGLIAGYFEVISNYLSLSRTFVFFPIFLIGYYLSRDHFQALQKPKMKGLAISLFVITFISYFYIDFQYEWLFGSKPYSHFGHVTIMSSIIRLGFYSITLITSLSFLSLIPKSYRFFTEWGTRTFYVYLLHGFIIQYLRNSEWLDFMKDYQSMTLLIILSIFMTAILSTTVVKALTQPLIELRTSTIHHYLKSVSKS
ncbi:acyltransferase family protein [Metabacillus malikii]|uniref:Fucose 4-O-acetylase-like acetyltransferase n=1 Tax=Metabacillus malikii TaxID=1504265 RepID=A0ABT9ZB30_9BACI|nr:acyltransferase family protein [Metabacillus malikii]MDQ0229468.1 fucose 4-O-acetylase-like acetyltransferase [Metabacillus malikii]